MAGHVSVSDRSSVAHRAALRSCRRLSCQLSGWTDGRLDHVARIMESSPRRSSPAQRVTPLPAAATAREGSVALLLTVAYAFGTTTWLISSQALWQHGWVRF